MLLGEHDNFKEREDKQMASTMEEELFGLNANKEREDE